MKMLIPPIKSQGIKTKLVPLIRSVVPTDFRGRWIEPFMGTGCVGFNTAPGEALMCDANPGIISFYHSLSSGEITSRSVRSFLESEGKLLEELGEDYYYQVRERFNSFGDPLDFLFVNRACFNGMIRFNRQGKFNTPFCRKPQRFSPSYITKIVNQVERLAQLFSQKRFEFELADFAATIEKATEEDVIYCDPPYIGRYSDYYNSWTDENETMLFSLLKGTKARFILSTWSHNEFRKNEYFEKCWSRFNTVTQDHFYHLGGREENRRPMVEALVFNYSVSERKTGSSYAKLTVESGVSTPLFNFYPVELTPPETQT